MTRALSRNGVWASDVSIDGLPVGDGYGVLIKQKSQDSLIPPGLAPQAIVPLPPLEVYLTKRNARDEYEPLRRVYPHTLTGWDSQGRALNFEGGVLTIQEIRDA